MFWIRLDEENLKKKKIYYKVKTQRVISKTSFNGFFFLLKFFEPLNINIYYN